MKGNPHDMRNSSFMHQLILLRHGESDWNGENRLTAWTDVDLSEAGIREARRARR